MDFNGYDAGFFDSGTRICLEIGTPLEIEVEGTEISFQSDFIGMEPNKYMIISLPRPFDLIHYELVHGSNITIKYIFKETVYTFNSKLLASTADPAQLIFIEYPKAVQHSDLRSHKRMHCFIPAMITIKGKENHGAVLDINKKGCRCQISGLGSEAITPAVTIEEYVGLKLKIPEIENELEIVGQITNMTQSRREVDFGVMFHNTPLEMQKMISQYILSIYNYS